MSYLVQVEEEYWLMTIVQQVRKTIDDEHRTNGTAVLRRDE